MQEYKMSGTCASSVSFELDGDGVVRACSFKGGCPGNTVGVARLAVGRKAADLVSSLKGVPCPRSGGKTSCPDQFARALEAELAKSGPVVATA